MMVRSVKYSHVNQSLNILKRIILPLRSAHPQRPRSLLLSGPFHKTGFVFGHKNLSVIRWEHTGKLIKIAITDKALSLHIL